MHIAGATPVQRFEASDVPAAPWYAGGTILGLAICLAAVGYVAAPVAEMVVRLRGRPAARRRTQRPAVAADPAPAAPDGVDRRSGCSSSVLAFITLLVLFSVNQAGAWPAVLAGWLVVRVLAVLMLVQEVTAVAAVVSGLREGWRPTPLAARARSPACSAAPGCCWWPAAYYGLFVPLVFPW